MISLASDNQDENAGYTFLATLLCILSIALLAEFAMQRLHQRFKKFPLIPSCFVFMFVGLVLGLIHKIDAIPRSFTQTLDRLVDDFPTMMLTLFLPAIVLQSGVEMGAGAASGGLTFAISRHHMLPALLLAIVGTLFAIFSGGAVLYGMGKLNFSTEYCIIGAFLVSTCIAPTDTVAVLNVFDSLDVKKSLYALFYFESMFNDAVALVSFSAFRSFLESDADGTGEIVKQSFTTVGLFVAVFIGSGVIGLLVGLAIALLFRFGDLTPRWSYFKLQDSPTAASGGELDRYGTMGSSMSLRNEHNNAIVPSDPYASQDQMSYAPPDLATSDTSTGTRRNRNRRRSISFTVSQRPKSRRASLASTGMPSAIAEEEDMETIISDVQYHEDASSSTAAGTGIAAGESIDLHIAGIAAPGAEPKPSQEEENSLGQDLERCIAVIAGFASYMITESVNFSGVVAALFSGIAIGAWAMPNVTPSSKTFNLSLLRVLAKISDSTVFLLMGLMLPMLLDLRHHWKTALIFLLAAAVGRFSAVYFSAAIVNPFRDKRSKVTEAHRRILFWGGLRGGLALALAFEAKKHLISAGQPDVAEGIPVSVMLVAVVTLVVVPVTMGPLLKHLKLLVNTDADKSKLRQLKGRSGGWKEVPNFDDESGNGAMDAAKRPLIASTTDDDYMINVEEEEYFPPVPENAVDTRIIKRIRIFFTMPSD